MYVGAVAQLPLVSKVKIAVGIALGIVFLHQTKYEYEGEGGYLKWSKSGVRISESELETRKILLDEVQFELFNFL